MCGLLDLEKFEFNSNVNIWDRLIRYVFYLGIGSTKQFIILCLIYTSKTYFNKLGLTEWKSETED